MTIRKGDLYSDFPSSNLVHTHDQNFLSKMQIWINNIIVNDTLRFLTAILAANDHRIFIPHKDYLIDKLVLSLTLKGVYSTFSACKSILD